MVKPMATGISTSLRAVITGRVMEAVSRRAREHIATVVAMTRTRIHGWRNNARMDSGHGRAEALAGTPGPHTAKVGAAGEVLDAVGILLAEHPGVDEGEGDAADVLGALEAPFAQHPLRHH